MGFETNCSLCLEFRNRNRFYTSIRIYEIAMLESQVFALDMPVEKLSYLDALVENIRKMKIYIFFLKEFRKQT